MTELVSHIEEGGIEYGANESTSLLHVSPSQADIEIAKRDTREPYLVVAVKELQWMISSSFWTALAMLLQGLLLFVNIISVGHIGATELAAITLSSTCFGVIAMGPSIGITGAMETFCSNAYTASRDKTMVGLHLQRGMVAVLIHVAIAIPILLNGEWLLLRIVQDPLVAQLGGQYLRIQILGLIPLTMFEACKGFLQSQEIMSAGAIVLICVMPIHVAMNYFLVWSSTYGVGFNGAAIANVITEFLMFAGIIACIRFSRAIETWGGWNHGAFQNMPEFYSLAIPGIIAICAEWIYCELLNVGSSYFSTESIAATAIALNTAMLAFFISDGLGYSATPRIGNLIGDGKPRQAQITRDMTIVTAAVISLLCLLFLATYEQWWISLYTNDQKVIDKVQNIMPALYALLFWDGVNGVQRSIMRGLGQQKASAWTYMIGFYCIGVPLGLYLGFWMHMEELGLWWSILIATIFIFLVQFTYAYYWVDWKDEVRKCLVRLQLSQGENNENWDVADE